VPITSKTKPAKTTKPLKQMTKGPLC